MNIFAFSPDPACAKYLDDLRLNKMITETAQLLSTAVAYRDYKAYDKDKRFMLPAYTNHPCTKWARANVANMAWLTLYMQQLHAAWNAPHRSTRVLSAMFDYLGEHVFHTQPASFVQCTPGFESVADVHQAYREYMSSKWKRDIRPPTWTRRNIEPEWRHQCQDSMVSTSS